MRLILALAVIPAALADSDCDAQCVRLTGLISCGPLRDCHNRLADLLACECKVKWWIAFLMTIAGILVAASCCWQCCGGKKMWRCFMRECFGWVPPETPKEKEKREKREKREKEEEKARKALEEARKAEDIVNSIIGTLRQYPTLQNSTMVPEGLSQGCHLRVAATAQRRKAEDIANGRLVDEGTLRQHRTLQNSTCCPEDYRRVAACELQGRMVSAPAEATPGRIQMIQRITA
jgi:hypothetical protein